MKIVKSPQTIYLKDLEREELELIANIKNIERTKEGKKILSISNHIHIMLQLGINAELNRLNLPRNGITPSEPNKLLEKYKDELKKIANDES